MSQTNTGTGRDDQLEAEAKQTLRIGSALREIADLELWETLGSP